MRWLALAVAGLLILGACSTPLDNPTPGPTLGATLPELLAGLRDSDPDVRLEAAQRLGELGDETAVPALVQAAEDEDPDVGIAAIEAIAAIGGDDAADALVEMTSRVPELLDDTHRDRYTAAVGGLGTVGGPRAVARLFEIKVGDDILSGFVWEATDAAIASLGPDDVPAVVAALDHEDEDVRLEAITCLKTIGGAAAIDALIEQVGAADDHVRSAAIEALGEAGATEATAVLVKALKDGDVSWEATQALVAIYRADAAPLLKYLKSKSTVKIYLPLIKIGEADTEDALVTALNRYGTKGMAEDYLNCGNGTLEKAARAWARKHGYTVITLPGAGSVSWGEG